MDRVKANDLVMGALFKAWEKQGVNITPAIKIYEKQRAIIEAEEVIKSEHLTNCERD